MTVRLVLQKPLVRASESVERSKLGCRTRGGSSTGSKACYCWGDDGAPGDPLKEREAGKELIPPSG
jgi:hypothetical protein